MLGYIPPSISSIPLFPGHRHIPGPTWRQKANDRVLLSIHHRRKLPLPCLAYFNLSPLYWKSEHYLLSNWRLKMGFASLIDKSLYLTKCNAVKDKKNRSGISLDLISAPAITFSTASFSLLCHLELFKHWESLCGGVCVCTLVSVHTCVCVCVGLLLCSLKNQYNY